jgi:hypothetical protein
MSLEFLRGKSRSSSTPTSSGWYIHYWKINGKYGGFVDSAYAGGTAPDGTAELRDGPYPSRDAAQQALLRRVDSTR